MAQNPLISPELLNQRWQARWITSPDAPARDPVVVHFRKTVSLAAVPPRFVVHVSADNRFILYVNGVRVADGPARGDLFHWRYETVNLARHLHAGNNVLAATVWNFGTIAPQAQMSNRTAFLLQADHPTVPQSAAPIDAGVNTDESWQTKIETGRGIVTNGLAGVRNQYYVVGPAERLDARTFDWGWNTASGGTGLWKAAVELGSGSPREIQDAPNAWMLVPDSLPPMSMTPVSAGAVVRASGINAATGQQLARLLLPAHATVSILLDTGALQTAYPELTVSGGADSVVRLTYAEALVDSHGEKHNRNEIAGMHIVGNSDEFIADGQAQRTFTPLWWRTWRFLQLDITTADQPLTIDSMRAFFTAYPFQPAARFAAGARLDPVWRTGWRTAQLCAHETYMDCPYWEQLQYAGDTRVQALISYVMTGDDRLARQAITMLNASRLPEGLTQSRYPSALPQIIPPFSLMWVGMVHDFWMYRGDRRFVTGQLQGMRNVLAWFTSHQRPDGLLARLPWWDFVDWTEGYDSGVPPQDADGGSAPLTLQFVEALNDAADLESAIGDRARANDYSNRARVTNSAVFRLCWDAARGMIADTPAKQHFSQEANILAVWLDTIPARQQAEVLQRIVTAGGETLDGRTSAAAPNLASNFSTASYYFRFYLARALDHAGLADHYLDLLGPWYRMLDMGLSTWAETPEPTRSDCHAWSAHPNYDLLTLVAGIRPAAPGFRRVRIEPHLGGLLQLDAAMPAGGGLIEVAYRQTNGSLQASVDLPPGLDGDFVWRQKTYRLHPGHQVLTVK